jgi:predicted ATP-grasp superfamily ATP-dependent carboligase
LKRLLVHEFASGGGFAGRAVPAGLGREGRAMRDALVADLAALGRYRIVTSIDRRFPMRRVPAGVEVVTLGQGRAAFGTLLAGADAAWIIAPETGGCLERLVASAEAAGVPVLGSASHAIGRAGDKAALVRRLEKHGIRHPPTRVARSLGECRRAAQELGLPLVVKPARGAGSEGVTLVTSSRRLPEAVALARRAGGPGPLLVQRYCPGVAASVSLLSSGRRAVVLGVNAQRVNRSSGFAYRGGVTPLVHRLAKRAAATALATCRTLPGLKGYIGVDLVLTESEAIVIEVNPRLTTAYLGLRASFDLNLAGLAVAACAGRLPRVPRVERRVRFSASGRILAA